MGRAGVGWIISGLVAAFMLFDAFAKFAKPKAVVEAFARTQWSLKHCSTLGAILLVCTVLYLIPQTSVLGAILLTGYLGGAVATHLRTEDPLFSQTLFPTYLGAMSWIGLWLREAALGAVFPLIQ